MMKSKDSCKPSNYDCWVVNHAASNLMNKACTLSARHIKDGTLRIQLNREVAYYARAIANDVAQGKKSPQQGLREIKNEQSSLLDQSLEVAKKGVGVVAGALQFATGAGICYASVGTLCVFAGAPLMAHGANNMYESGRNLWEDRSDIQGPVRKGYQKAAKMMGGGEREGNIAYAGADLLLSAIALGRPVLKPDAWRLFRYVRSDYLRAYETTSKSALLIEAATNASTIKSMHEELRKRDQ